MNSIFLILRDRLSRAIATLPDLADGKSWLVVICIYALFTFTLGWRSGFLRWEYRADKIIAVRVMVTSLVAPAILEELFFRVVLLPYPSDEVSKNSYWICSGLSLFLFAIYHPLNALTFFPQGKEVFFNPIFLSLATALGVTCTVAYWQTGSLWMPVLIHWLTVVVWLLCFGGLRKVRL